VSYLYLLSWGSGAVNRILAIKFNASVEFTKTCRNVILREKKRMFLFVFVVIRLP